MRWLCSLGPRRRNVTSDDCVHHWIIEPAGGPTSVGVCAKCGAAKDFSNSVYTTPWGAGYHDRGGTAHRRKLRDEDDE